MWSFLEPAKGSPIPEARSYHSSASTPHPLSSRGDSTEDSLGGEASGFDDHGTFFLHGGCPASGRTADTWGFDVASRMWSQYADAPGPPRGGACLTFAQDRLYRFGGFDGTKELGGSLDFLHFTVSTFDDKGGEFTQIPIYTRLGSCKIRLRNHKSTPLTFTYILQARYCLPSNFFHYKIAVTCSHLVNDLTEHRVCEVNLATSIS